MAGGAELCSLEVQSAGTEPNVPISHVGSILGNSLQEAAPDSVFRKSSTPQRFHKSSAPQCFLGNQKLHEEMQHNHSNVAGAAISTFHGCKACQGRGFHLLSGAHVNKPSGRSSICYEVCGICHGTCMAPPTNQQKQADPVTFFWEGLLGNVAVALRKAIEGLGCVRRVTEEQPWSSNTAGFQ